MSIFSSVDLQTLTSRDIPIHMFVIHKIDESSMLPFDWYIYHTNLVGTSNVHGIDHNSSDQFVISSLREQGIDIIPFTGSFMDKSKALTQRMHQFSDHPVFLIPLDIDEYLVAIVQTDSGITFSTNTTLIRSIILTLPRDGFKYKLPTYEGYFCNEGTDIGNKSVARRITHFAPSEMSVLCKSKTFFYSKGFISTDQGNHFGLVEGDKTCSRIFNNAIYEPLCRKCLHNNTGLAILHVGGPTALTYGEYLAKAIRASKAYEMNLTDPKAAANRCQRGSKGRHYCEFIMKSVEVGEGGMKDIMQRERDCAHRLRSDALSQTMDLLVAKSRHL
jgi:hypothetical protein